VAALPVLPEAEVVPASLEVADEPAAVARQVWIQAVLVYFAAGVELA
jgi:hypothetical protein